MSSDALEGCAKAGTVRPFRPMIAPCVPALWSERWVRRAVESAASVVCRALGYAGAESAVRGGAFGPGTGDIVMGMVGASKFHFHDPKH